MYTYILKVLLISRDFSYYELNKNDDYLITSPPIGACDFPVILVNYDRHTNRPTDQPPLQPTIQLRLRKQEPSRAKNRNFFETVGRRPQNILRRGRNYKALE